MKNMKKLMYGVASSLVLTPIAAFAQFEEPAGTGLPGGSIMGIVTNGMNWLLILVGVLGVIGFVIAGIIYLTAAGDEDQIGRGKRTMINSIIGIIVALLGLIIIRAVQGMLGGTSKAF